MQKWQPPSHLVGVKPGVYHGRAAQDFIDQNWVPGVQVMNTSGRSLLIDQFVRVQANDQVIRHQYWQLRVQDSMDVRQFPFDQHALNFVFASRYYDQKQVQLVAFEPESLSRVMPDLPEWHERWMGIKPTVLTIDERQHQGLVATVLLERKPWFYVSKLIMPLLILVYLSMMALWMRDDPTANRCVIPLTCLLTMVAFQWMVYGVVPKVSYQILLDGVILTSYITTSVVLFSIILFNHNDFFLSRPQLRQQIRWGFLWVYPTVLTLVALFFLF